MTNCRFYAKQFIMPMTYVPETVTCFSYQNLVSVSGTYVMCIRRIHACRIWWWPFQCQLRRIFSTARCDSAAVSAHLLTLETRCHRDESPLVTPALLLLVRHRSQLLQRNVTTSAAPRWSDRTKLVSGSVRTCLRLQSLPNNYICRDKQ